MHMRASLGLLFGFTTALASAGAHSAATILLWPIDPWLAAESNATELWIQNQGDTPTTMQVRIVRWRQDDGFERYQPQQDVVASPQLSGLKRAASS